MFDRKFCLHFDKNFNKNLIKNKNNCPVVKYR